MPSLSVTGLRILLLYQRTASSPGLHRVRHEITLAAVGIAITALVAIVLLLAAVFTDSALETPMEFTPAEDTYSLTSEAWGTGTIHDAVGVARFTDRSATLTELSNRVGITQANLSNLKTGKARAIRFTTLDAICKELQCQPGDLLSHTTEQESPD